MVLQRKIRQQKWLRAIFATRCVAFEQKFKIRMKFLIGILFILSSMNCFSQFNNGIPEERQKQLETIIDLVRNDQIIELSKKILYPIKRQNPIPDIKTREEFILYYPILFDSTFKAKLTNTIFDSTNTINYYTGFGLFLGDIWLFDDGDIMTINYQSTKELELLNKLHTEIEGKIHKSVSNWKKNILVCETEKFLIRIDLLENNDLRYISWNKPKTISDKPDLILMKGIQEFQGTMGGITYTFQNQDWTYQIDRVEMAETDDKFGLYLRLYQNGIEKATYKTKEIK